MAEKSSIKDKLPLKIFFKSTSLEDGKVTVKGTRKVAGKELGKLFGEGTGKVPKK